MSLHKLSKEFRRIDGKITDNWISHQFYLNDCDEERTRRALKKDEKELESALRIHKERAGALKEGNFRCARTLLRKIEKIVRGRNLPLEKLEQEDAPCLVFDLHFLLVEQALIYVAEIEKSLRNNRQSLVSRDRTVQLISGIGRNSRTTSSALKSALLETYGDRIKASEENPGVLILVVPKQVTVWDFIEAKLYPDIH